MATLPEAHIALPSLLVRQLHYKPVQLNPLDLATVEPRSQKQPGLHKHFLYAQEGGLQKMGTLGNITNGLIHLAAFAADSHNQPMTNIT